jgi:hypothetical protein
MFGLLHQDVGETLLRGNRWSGHRSLTIGSVPSCGSISAATQRISAAAAAARSACWDNRLTGWSQDLIAQSPPLAYQSRQLGMQAFSASAADFGLGSCFAGRPRPSAPSARALK